MDPETTTVAHRTRRAAAILIELRQRSAVTTVACVYTRARCWWTAIGEPEGGLAALMQLIAGADPRVQAAIDAIPAEWVPATERVVDHHWAWICSDAPMPVLIDPADLHPLDMLAEEMEIAQYVPIDAKVGA